MEADQVVGPGGSEEGMLRAYFSLPRRAIGELRFVLEAYEGLGFVRTLDAAAGIIELAWPASRQQEMQTVLPALRTEFALLPVAAPAGVEPL